MVAISKRGLKGSGTSKCTVILNVLLTTNLLMLIYFFMSETKCWNDLTLVPPQEGAKTISAAGSDGGAKSATSLSDKKPLAVSKQQQQRDFYEIGVKSGTDKVQANIRLPGCLENPKSCTRPGCKRKECRPWGHYYQTIYQDRLGPYSTDDAEPFQFLEIGYFNGGGFDTYTEFLPNAELHSMEISCLPEGKREDGKWPWGNFAEKNKNYNSLLKADRLHCGDASDVKWLHKVWTQSMKRKDSPPLKVVVDDGAHLQEHMATSVFFWFPRIEPGGFMIVEDVQPISEANKFRTQFLPQIMADLHYCGDPKLPDEPCFPTLMPLLQSIHCEMHICIFQRNNVPASEPDLNQSSMPANALDFKQCTSFKK